MWPGRKSELGQDPQDVRAAPTLDHEPVLESGHLECADVESSARRSVPHVLTEVRPGHPKYQREVVVVGEHDVGRECEVGERFEESAPVVFGALEPGRLIVGGIVIDDVFGEELTETVEVVGGDELAAER